MERRVKREQALSVGMDPSKAPTGASRSAYLIRIDGSWGVALSMPFYRFPRSTLDAAWSRILSEADEEASDHTNLAESLQNQICEVLKAAERKKEATRKKVCASYICFRKTHSCSVLSEFIACGVFIEIIGGTGQDLQREDEGQYYYGWSHLHWVSLTLIEGTRLNNDTMRLVEQLNLHVSSKAKPKMNDTSKRLPKTWTATPMT